MILYILAITGFLRELLILLAVLVCLWLIILWISKSPLDPSIVKVLVWILRGLGILLVINFILGLFDQSIFHLFGQ